MSETERFLNKSGADFRPLAAAVIHAVAESINALCGGKFSLGEPSVKAGAKAVLPQKPAEPLVAAVIEASGDVAGKISLAFGAGAAKTMAALVVGGEPPAEAAQAGELSADELDAVKKMFDDAASSIATAFRSALHANASVSVKSVSVVDSAEKALEPCGAEFVLLSAEGKIAGREAAILLACETSLCSAAVDKIAAANQTPEAPRPERSEPVSKNVKRILRLPVPLIVVLVEKQTTFNAVLALSEGSVIEFDKSNDEPLDLLVNNRKIGQGKVLKVGEHFGLRIDEIGTPQQIVEKLR
jgi:flagellar motor switch protein FliN/FliY